MAAGWWFLVVNAIVAAIAVLSSLARRPPPSAPRDGAAATTITRRASSTVLQRLRSFSIFSLPSGCFHTTEPFLQPAASAVATGTQETEEPAAVTSSVKSPTRALELPPAAPVPAAEEDSNGMSMDEAYALVVAARQRPEAEREEEARRSEVDAKAEEFIQGFKDDLRQRRLHSIFNYKQMLKQSALGRGRP